MSEQTKTYVPCSGVKEIKFQNGNTILKLNLRAKDVAEFLLKHANAKGYVTLGISARRSVGQYGDTHCLWLDTWQPDPNRQRQPQPKSQPDFADVATAMQDGPPPF